uniref:glycosyltransferase n=1 Tax=Microbacterium sp. SORGH_AS_1204 TaxID=3041785 RepID=UPI0035946973
MANCGSSVLFAGSIRADKGVQYLPEVATRLQGVACVELAVGIVPSGLLAQLTSAANLHLVGDGRSYLPDRAFFEALSRASVMVAPYSDVTTSGTVMMAATMAVPVVAFESEGLARVPGRVHTVRTGNVQGLADECAQVIRRPSPLGAETLAAYDESAGAAWKEVARFDKE